MLLGSFAGCCGKERDHKCPWSCISITNFLSSRKAAWAERYTPKTIAAAFAGSWCFF